MAEITAKTTTSPRTQTTTPAPVVDISVDIPYDPSRPVTLTPEQEEALNRPATTPEGEVPAEVTAPSEGIDSAPVVDITPDIPEGATVLTPAELARIESVPVSAAAFASTEALASGDVNRVLTELTRNNAPLATKLSYLHQAGFDFTKIDPTVPSHGELYRDITKLNALTGKDQFDFAVSQGLVPKGSRYVAGKEGKWSYISERELGRVAAITAQNAKPPMDMAVWEQDILPTLPRVLQKAYAEGGVKGYNAAVIQYNKTMSAAKTRTSGPVWSTAEGTKEFQENYTRMAQPSSISDADYAKIAPFVYEGGIYAKGAYDAGAPIDIINRFVLENSSAEFRQKVKSGELVLLPYGDVIPVVEFTKLANVHQNMLKESGFPGLEAQVEQNEKDNKAQSWWQNNIIDPLTQASVESWYNVKGMAIQEATRPFEKKYKEGDIKPAYVGDPQMAALLGERAFFTAEEAVKENKLNQQTVKSILDTYSRSEKARTNWIAENPLLESLYPAGPLQAIKDNPLNILNPSLWASTVMSTLPYTMAGVALIAGGGALGGPPGAIAGGTVAFGLTWGVEGHDIYRQAIAAGDTREHARMLMEVYGALSAAVETTGDAIFVGMGTTALKAVTGSLGKKVAAGVIADAAKKFGWKALSANVILNFINQSSQEAVQAIIANAAIRTVDENRPLLEGAMDSFVAGAIGSAPFVLFPAGGMAIKANLDSAKKLLKKFGAVSTEIKASLLKSGAKPATLSSVKKSIKGMQEATSGIQAAKPVLQDAEQWRKWEGKKVGDMRLGDRLSVLPEGYVGRLARLGYVSSELDGMYVSEIQYILANSVTAVQRARMISAQQDASRAFIKQVSEFVDQIRTSADELSKAVEADDAINPYVKQMIMDGGQYIKANVAELLTLLDVSNVETASWDKTVPLGVVGSESVDLVRRSLEGFYSAKTWGEAQAQLQQLRGGLSASQSSLSDDFRRINWESSDVGLSGGSRQISWQEALEQQVIQDRMQKLIDRAPQARRNNLRNAGKRGGEEWNNAWSEFYSYLEEVYGRANLETYLKTGEWVTGAPEGLAESIKGSEEAAEIIEDLVEQAKRDQETQDALDEIDRLLEENKYKSTEEPFNPSTSPLGGGGTRVATAVKERVKTRPETTVSTIEKEKVEEKPKTEKDTDQKEQIKDKVERARRQIEREQRQAQGETTWAYSPYLRNLLVTAGAIDAKGAEWLSPEQAIMASKKLSEQLRELLKQSELTQQQLQAQLQTQLSVQQRAQLQQQLQTLVQEQTQLQEQIQQQTQLQEQLQQQQQTRIIPRPRIRSKGGRDDRQQEIPSGSIAWRQGIFWKWIPREDYTTGAAKPRTLPRGVTPMGAIHTDLRKPAETIQMIGDPGASVPDIAVDLGVADIFISDQAQTIQYAGKGAQTDVGVNVPSTTLGMTIEGRAEGISRPDMPIVRPAHSVSRTAIAATTKPDRVAPNMILSGLDRPEVTDERKRVATAKAKSAKIRKIESEPADDTEDFAYEALDELGPEGSFGDEDPHWLDSKPAKRPVNRVKAKTVQPIREQDIPSTMLRGIR